MYIFTYFNLGKPTQKPKPTTKKATQKPGATTRKPTQKVPNREATVSSGNVLVVSRTTINIVHESFNLCFAIS